MAPPLLAFSMVLALSVLASAEVHRMNQVQNSAEESLDLQKILRAPQETKPDGCQCVQSTYDCGCCVHLDFPKIGLDDTGCLNITYLAHDYGIAVEFSIDGKVVYKYEVSARNPPPLCFGLPDLKAEASLCLDLYNLDISDKTFSGCAKVEAEFVHIKIGEIDLGCFSVPLNESDQNGIRDRSQVKL